MKQLSGVDATFLYMEDGAVFGHVSSVSIYERPSPGFDPYEAWREQIARRLHVLEPLTRRLRTVPFGIDHPHWVVDPDFDLEFHVRHTAVPAPGSDREVADLVARIIGRPLDRARPLWESYIIEGLAGDRFAILTKIHHAAVDGASGAELLTLMLDSSVEGDEVVGPDSATPRISERVPTDAEMLATAAVNLAGKPARLLVLTARTARAMGQATRNPILTAAGEQLRDGLRGPLGALLNRGRARPEERDVTPSARPLPGTAPRTSFNAPITPHRSFAFGSVPLSAVKEIKTALGATVNDVVMAICAGALRRYLDGRGELPDTPLVTMVPVSIRTGQETERWTNRVSGVVAELPTDEADPVERVRKVHESMAMAKELHDAIPADVLTQFADFPPPAVFTRASRMATRFQNGNRFDPPVNLVISNVPGPRQPLYAAGARLQHYVPVSTIVHGQGLNITVQSYLDTLDVGLVGCADLVPDIWDLMDAFVASFEELAAVAGVDTGSGAPATTAPGTTHTGSTPGTGVRTRTPAEKRATKRKAASGKRAASKKTGTKKTGTKKTGTKKTAATKTAATKTGTAKKRATAKKTPAKKTGTAKKRTPAKKAPAKKATSDGAKDPLA